jgi:hypothetical protein
LPSWTLLATAANTKQTRPPQTGSAIVDGSRPIRPSVNFSPARPTSPRTSTSSPTSIAPSSWYDRH